MTHEIPILDAMQPFLKVRAKKRKRGDDNEDGENDQGEPKPKGRRGRKKNKGKNVDAAQEGHDEPETAPVAGPSRLTHSGAEGAPNPEEDGENVLVVHKIASMEVNHERYLIFSAVGSVTSSRR